MNVVAIAGVFIMSREPEKLASFYKDIIGLPLSYDHTEGVNEGGVHHYECDLGDVHFAIHPQRGDKDLSHKNDAVSFALTVKDLSKYIQHLNSHGVKLIFGPMKLDFGQLAGIQDPDGNTIQFVELS